MTRITMTDLGYQLEVYRRLLIELGIDHSHLQIIEGSKKHGNSFKLVRVDPQSGGQSGAVGTHTGFLGWTKREAWDKMNTINSTLFDVSYHLNN